MSGTYKRNGYSEAQKRGIKNWSQSMDITGKTKKRHHVSLDDKQFREFRRKIDDMQDMERLLVEFQEVWE